jgi:hypothetical protein
VAPFRDERAAPASLWSAFAPPPPRHQVGFPMTADPGRRCGTCAWRYQDGGERCRQAGGARIAGAWQACNRWEEPPACQECGACCRAAYQSVTVDRDDPVVRAHPHLVVDRTDYVELARRTVAGEDRCIALGGGPATALDGRLPRQPFACAIYADRPVPCREFENSGPHCLTARRRVGLSR